MSQQPNFAYAVPSPAPAPNGPVPISQVTAPLAFYPLATNACSIVSLIVGCVAWVIPFLGGLVAVVLGHVALGQLRHRGQGGRNLAVTGLIMGYLSLIVWFLLIFGIVMSEFPPINVPGVGTVEV